MTAEPLKWVSQPWERRGSSCASTVGKVSMPFVFISIKSVRGRDGSLSKTPYFFVDEELLKGSETVGARFWCVRICTSGSM